MGGLREERFSVSGSGVENEVEGERGVETIGGDGNKPGIVMKKNGKTRRLVSVPAAPRTTGKRKRATTLRL